MEPNHLTADEVLKIHNEVFYGALKSRNRQIAKDSLWKSEPLEQELSHKRSQDGH